MLRIIASRSIILRQISIPKYPLCGLSVHVNDYSHLLSKPDPVSSIFGYPLSLHTYSKWRCQLAEASKLFSEFFNAVWTRSGHSSRRPRKLARDSKSHVGKEKNRSRTETEDKPVKDSNEFSFSSGPGRLLFLFAFALTSFMILEALSNPFQSGGRVLTWSEFVNDVLPSGQVSKIEVIRNTETAVIYMDSSAPGKRSGAVYHLQIPSVSRLDEEIANCIASNSFPPSKEPRVIYRNWDFLSAIIAAAVLFGLVFLLAKFLRSRLKVSFDMRDIVKQMFKPNIEIIDPHGGKKLKIRFNDIAGLHEAKLEIQEFVDYIKSPAKYTKLGAKLPRGALLTGPPGCGKTLLAKALAAESSVPFLSINGTEFVEMIGGLGAQRVRSLFEEAKARAPCMIFIDEIDSIGKKRTGSGFAASEENEQTLNQLLVAMDGMDSSKTVVVFGSTNRADTLDKALLRPGRFDRHILIGLPNVKEREEMFLLYLRKIKLDKEPEMYAKRLAQLTPGFSGADIYNVVNQAAIQAGSNNKSCVTIAEIDFALNRVLAGAEKRSQVMQKEEKRTVAFHEAGHVLAGWLLKHTDALLKVSIVPRTSAALGFSKYNQGDRLLFSKEELFDRMCMSLGGRAAENIVFGKCSTAAQDDLEKVTKSSYAQVKFYGMSEKIGPLSFQMDPDTEVNADFRKKPYSSSLQHLIDQEAANLVSQAYYATEELLSKNREKLEIIANALLKKEVLNYEDVKKLIGPPKYGEKTVVELADQVLPKPEDMNYQI